MSWAADFGLEWIEAATGVTHRITLPRDALVALAGAVAANAPDMLGGPQVVRPGDPLGHARMQDGSILTMGAGGEVYRDGQQLASIFARQIVQFGNSLYAQGKTTPTWWKWTGTIWSPVTAFDPAVLAD